MVWDIVLMFIFQCFDFLTPFLFEWFIAERGSSNNPGFQQTIEFSHDLNFNYWIKESSYIN